VDGYGSSIMMDDANLPSLLALPLIGFLDASNEVYRNTRRMILEEGNPYYLQGRSIKGGGPHSKCYLTCPRLYTDIVRSWHTERLANELATRAMTSEDDAEIMESLHFVRNSSRMGLVHESINVNRLTEYTRKSYYRTILYAQNTLIVRYRAGLPGRIQSSRRLF
jgi:meiotically up-regulated gene 157 (Mug157) protein